MKEKEKADLWDVITGCIRDQDLACTCLACTEGDVRQLAAFLVADRCPGEPTWKSPYISKDSEIHRIIQKYEGTDG